jgi:hypothetical protein
MFRSDICFIVLDQLNCLETQERRFDEPYLELRLRDTATDKLVTLQLKLPPLFSGATWPLKLLIPLRRRDIFALRLWEEDMPDADDHVGTLAVRGDRLSGFPNPDHDRRTHAFHRHGRYEVNYRLVGPEDLVRVTGATTNTEQIEGNNGPIVLASAVVDEYTVINLAGMVAIGGDAT